MKKAVVKNPLLFRCDKYPGMRVVIPVWRDDEALKAQPAVQFAGGCLDLDRVAKNRELTPKQVEQAVAVLKTTQWVYMEHPPTGELIKCGSCGEQFKTAKDLRIHELWKHGEEMNVVSAQKIALA